MVANDNTLLFPHHMLPDSFEWDGVSDAKPASGVVLWILDEICMWSASSLIGKFFDYLTCARNSTSARIT